MRVVLYARVSTDAQERDGTSLETQEAACREYAERQGWTVLECIREAASGYSLDRLGLGRVRELLRSGSADVVLAYAFDRLSRRQTQQAILFGEAEEAGARLEFVTERFERTAVGMLLLNVYGFVAEVEREKILERTTRGKLARARSGKIPQGMGRGTYGYIYNPRTGHREIDPPQAEIVRRIFQRYAETRSFNAVSKELNEEGVPAYRGGGWHPLTIRRMLTNESYTGKLMFGQTRWVPTRGRDGKNRRRPVARPLEEQIEIEGASPAILGGSLWERVQTILSAPERIARRATPHVYALRGRAKCGVCGSGIAVQTLKVSSKPYRYYRCTHAYDRRRDRACATRYIPAEKLESAVWGEIERVLAHPATVLAELERASQSQSVEPGEVAKLEKRLAKLKEQERRLIRLFATEDGDDSILQDELAATKRERRGLEEKVTTFHRPTIQPRPTQAMLSQACAAVTTWLAEAGAEDRQLALEALQISVTVTREEASISGVLPLDPDAFITDQRASPCTLHVEKLGSFNGQDTRDFRFVTSRLHRDLTGLQHQ